MTRLEVRFAMCPAIWAAPEDARVEDPEATLGNCYDGP